MVMDEPVDGEGQLQKPNLFMTVYEVASLFRVSTMTVYRLIDSGELPAVRVGRSYRLATKDVDQYLADQIVG